MEQAVALLDISLADVAAAVHLTHGGGVESAEQERCDGVLHFCNYNRQKSCHSALLLHSIGEDARSCVSLIMYVIGAATLYLRKCCVTGSLCCCNHSISPWQHHPLLYLQGSWQSSRSRQPRLKPAIPLQPAGIARG